MIKKIIIRYPIYLRNIAHDKLCNQISENKIVDLITLETLPMTQKENPNKLVLIIYLMNGCVIVHDLVSIKTWLEKRQPYTEPLTNLQLPINILDRIKYRLNKVKHSIIRWGLRKNTPSLISGCLESIILTETSHLLVGYKPNNEYILWSIDVVKTIPNVPSLILEDIKQIRKGLEIQEYDYIIQSIKIRESSQLLKLVLPDKFDIYSLGKVKALIKKYKSIEIINKTPLSKTMKQYIVRLLNDWSYSTCVAFVALSHQNIPNII